MRHLPTPLGDALERDLDEERVHALWRGTERLLAERATGARPRRSAGRRSLALLLAAGGVAVAALVASQQPTQSAGAAASVATADEPVVFLTLADGSAPVMVRTGATQRAIRFVDGSTVTVAPASVLAPLVNDAHELALGLDAGRVEVDVVPGGERRWRIVCGPVAVDVVGTHFSVERRVGSVLVDVTHGVVRVSGEPLRGGAALVQAGESLEIDVEVEVGRDRDVPERAASLAVAELAAPDRPPLGASPERVPSPAPPSAPATGGEEPEAPAPGRAPVAARDRMTVPELMASADEARLSDRPADAIPILEQLLATHADDAEAPLAAIILARIERARGHHARAAEVLRIALELGVPRTLDEEVRAERIGELEAAGARERCAAEARTYLETYPDGAHVADARRCLLAP